jgi:predicted AlkP superfamily phosphohydrolase/phosphomutase
MKLLIIGIDGATFDLILPWIEGGHLPNLEELVRSGVYSDLASTLPPVTSPAWPTFMTGCNPGKHGVFDFIQSTGAAFQLVNATKIKQPTLWQRLSDAGYQVGVLNVPVTYPPQPLNGFMISGILSPKSGRISYPEDLIARHRLGLGDYRVAPNVQYKQGNERAFIEDVTDLIRSQGDWALRLMEQEPWDVLMVHFIALDIMMHALWRFMDRKHPRYEPTPFENAIRNGYELVDDYIGRLLGQLPEECVVMVMSDHGFGPLKSIVNLNNFLMEKGLLKLRRDPLTSAKAAAFRRGLSPAIVYRWVERAGLQNMATRVSKNTRNKVMAKFLSFDSVDWSRTVAYSMGHVGQIYLNVAGREPEGIVTEGDYQQKRNDVIEALSDLRDLDGKPLVSRIVNGEDTYHGPYAKFGPDLHLVLDDYNVIAFPLFATDGKVVTRQIRGDSGCHRREGIFVIHGPEIASEGRISPSNITDLTPTILHLLGERVPRSMDGKVLHEVFRSPRDVSYVDDELDENDLVDDVTLSEDEAAQVEERLRSLGYL